MKLFIFLILLSLSFSAFSMSSCNNPEIVRVSYPGGNTVIETYPSGNCDYLGYTKSNKYCRNQARKQKYDCYQIGTRRFIGRYEVVSNKCYACYK